MDVVSELPSLTHAQLSEPSIQLTALPVPYTTDYTFMHNSQHAHNISMPHYSPSSLSSRQFESCCGSVRTSRRPSPLSLLSGISTATHYIHTYYILISGRLTLHWCQKWDSNPRPFFISIYTFWFVDLGIGDGYFYVIYSPAFEAAHGAYKKTPCRGPQPGKALIMELR